MLQEIADTLQAPKRWLWGMLPGLHDEQTGEAYTGAQVAHNAFGTDPEGVWGKALGMGLDIAGDPLNLAVPLLGRGMSALAGLKYAAPAAEAAGAASGGEGALGRVLASYGKAGGEGAFAPGSRAGAAYSSLRPMRQTFGMVKNVENVEPSLVSAVESLADSGGLGRGVYWGADAGTPRLGTLTGRVDPHMMEAIQNYADTGLRPGKANGFFASYKKPDAQGLTGAGMATSPVSARHEIVHGLINAGTLGDASALPLAMRVPAVLRRSTTPFVRGVGEIFNEAAAHGLENHGMLNQLGGAAKFLMQPTDMYAEQIARLSGSPWAATLYRSTPYATASGLAGGLGAGSYMATMPFLGE